MQSYLMSLGKEDLLSVFYKLQPGLKRNRDPNRLIPQHLSHLLSLTSQLKFQRDRVVVPFRTPTRRQQLKANR